jgi:hypothetical protein
MQRRSQSVLDVTRFHPINHQLYTYIGTMYYRLAAQKQLVAVVVEIQVSMGILQ